MAKFLEVMAIVVSVCSVASSLLYNWVYVVGQRASFFNQVHDEFASPDMMAAFDTLEGFLAATGPARYSEEFIRLKGRTREVHFSALAGAPTLGAEHEVGLGQELDTSRRRILHYFGKLLMFNRLGYLSKEMLSEFPGRTRAAHALRLLEPLVEATAVAYQMPLEEHRQILDGVRALYGLPLPRRPRAEDEDVASMNGSLDFAAPAQWCGLDAADASGGAGKLCGGVGAAAAAGPGSSAADGAV